MATRRSILLLALNLITIGIFAQTDSGKGRKSTLSNPTFVPTPPAHSRSQQDSTMLHTKKHLQNQNPPNNNSSKPMLNKIYGTKKDTIK